MFSVSFLVVCLGRLQAGGKREGEKADTDVAKQLSDMTSVNAADGLCHLLWVTFNFYK